jgi:hypothetical protein
LSEASMRVRLQYRASNNFTFVVTVNENYAITQANCEASASLNWLRNEGRAQTTSSSLSLPRNIP